MVRAVGFELTTAGIRNRGSTKLSYALTGVPFGGTPFMFGRLGVGGWSWREHTENSGGVNHGQR